MRYRILGAVRLPSETRDGGSREWVAYETGLVTEKAVSKREVQRIEQKIDIPKDASGLNDRLLETLIDVYPHSPACQVSLVCLKSRNPDMLIGVWSGKIVVNLVLSALQICKCPVCFERVDKKAWVW